MINTGGEGLDNLDGYLHESYDLHEIISRALLSKPIIEYNDLNGHKLDFLETFSDLFTAAFRQGKKIDFGYLMQKGSQSGSINSQLKIECQIKKLKKQDLINFMAVLLAISEGRISASCTIPIAALNQGVEKIPVVVGAKKWGKTHIVFSEFGWKVVVASCFPFAMIQYAAQHTVFTEYIKKLQRIYDEQYSKTIQETEFFLVKAKKLNWRRMQ